VSLGKRLLLLLLAAAPAACTPAGVVLPRVQRAAVVDGTTQLEVPAGAFRMGSALFDPQRFGWEKPRHLVDLDAFWIDRTEVANAQFAAFVAATGYVTGPERAGASLVFDPHSGMLESVVGADWRHPVGEGSEPQWPDAGPVVHVTWEDARAYCQWASRRLPTEAEWEKAARGSDGRRYPWGGRAPAGDPLNFADRNLKVAWADPKADDGYAFTAPVGSYPAGASPYGALDMAGNVWEWVADWFDDNYYDVSPARDPQGPAAGAERVLRGGGWSSQARGVRAAHRDRMAPDKASDQIGFRCAATP